VWDGYPVRRSYRWTCHQLVARPDPFTDFHSRTIIGFEIRVTSLIKRPFAAAARVGFRMMLPDARGNGLPAMNFNIGLDENSR
jgi:hypothetical protein